MEIVGPEGGKVDSGGSSEQYDPEGLEGEVTKGSCFLGIDQKLWSVRHSRLA